MAKSSGGGGGGPKRRPQQHQHRPREQHRERPDRDRDLDRPPVMDMADDEPAVAAATAVEPAPPPPAKVETSSGGGGGGGTGEEVADFDQETNAKYEQVKGGKLFIKDLQTMDVHGLHEIAKQENIPDYIGLKKQDLIFQILRSRIRQNGLMYGEGVLEILPDGFGFLRSPEYNYLPCPDDIYISPSQIRRFGLRNGHVVQGQIRPPKESER